MACTSQEDFIIVCLNLFGGSGLPTQGLIQYAHWCISTNFCGANIPTKHHANTYILLRNHRKMGSGSFRCLHFGEKDTPTSCRLDVFAISWVSYSESRFPSISFIHEFSIPSRQSARFKIEPEVPFVLADILEILRVFLKQHTFRYLFG